jgi:hypothetical protein
MHASMDYVGTNELFPSSASEDEKALGLKETVIPAPNGAFFGEPEQIRVVTLHLDDDRFAIKMKRPDGVITYAIWSKNSGGPVEQGASSLAELQKRMGSRAPST